MDLDGQAAIVTGGGSGLGAATTFRLAAAGCRVTVLDLNGEAAEAVARQVGGASAACDVGDAASAEAAFAAARAAHGPVRLLVNCAGVAPAGRIVGRGGPMQLADFERVIRVNLIGTFNMLRLAASAMAKTDAITDDGQRGAVVNMASVAAFDGQIGQAAYSASKGGVVGLTLPVARDLAAVGIRVNTVAPGLIDTPIYGEGEASEAFKASLERGVLFPKRLGAPEELASMVVEAATNSYLNGETIRVDGGIRMQPK
jgi:NAD(P)-dependent dehydrogenase (short-subunit alcohol dehydrogenase family)